MEIILSYPYWFLLICFAVGAIYAGILYFKNSKNSELPKYAKYLAAAARFILATVLCFLLLSPLIKSFTKTLEKPIIVMVQDNSESILLNKDSLFYKNQYLQQYNQLAEDLSKDYEVVKYTAGDLFTQSEQIKFSEKQTDLESVILGLQNLYAGRNLGAVILASDGIYNKGINPIYKVQNLNAPIFSIALGDTSLKKNLGVIRVNANKIAYLNNKFPVEINIRADKLKNKKSVLTVSHKGKNLFSQNLSFDSDKYDLTIPVLIDATESGVQKYNIQLSRVEGEEILADNSAVVYVEVIDGRKKILILTEGPHPDAGALKLALNESENYEASIKNIAEFNGNVAEFSLVVMNQLPSLGFPSADLLDKINKMSIPVWYILGPKSNINAFNSQNTGLKIAGANGKTDDVKAMMNPNFSSFTTSEGLRNFIAKTEPIFSPFGNYEKAVNTDVLMFRKIGNTPTETPAFFFNVKGTQKIAVTAGEGIWRWRLSDFEEFETHEHFNELVNKTVQYLAVSEDKSKFRVNTKNLYLENEPVIIDAELYNDSYELVNDPEAQIKIINADRKEFPFVFAKTQNAYRLNAGLLPHGEYNYKATVSYNGKSLLKQGTFTVSKIDAEAQNTVADHSLMYQLAAGTGGEMVYPQQMQRIIDKIKSNQEIKTLSYSEKQLQDLIDLKLIFFLLLGLVTLEWFLRKFNGMY